MYKDINTFGIDATNVNAIKNSIKNILLTKRGSVPGKPNFGSDLYYALFSPLDSLTKSMVKNYVREALDEFEDRIVINDVQVKSVEEYNKLIIDVNFSYRDPNINEDTTDSAVVSFNL